MPKANHNITLLALLIAALVASMSITLPIMFDSSARFMSIGFVKMTVGFYLISIFFILLIGLPMFILLKHFKLFKWWTALIAGSVGGFAVPCIIFWKIAFSENGYLLFVAIGALSALVFWLILRLFNQLQTS
jgi:hypothetical protein